MRLAPLALVLALGLTTAAAQPTIDGDLTDSQYVLLDDNAGGPSTSFGPGLNELNAIYMHVDVPSSTLYLGVAGRMENGNRIVTFLDTRDGGYNTGDYGVGGPGAVSNFNQGSQFNPGFLADFAVVIGTDGTLSDYYIDVVELLGDRATGTSNNRFIGSASSSANIAAMPAADGTVTTTGFEIAIPFGDATAPTGVALAVTHPAVSAFSLLTSDSGFISNLTLSPSDIQPPDHYTDAAVNFGAVTGSDPLAYTWLRTSATAGWRMVGAPFQGLTVRDYALQNHVQGLAPSVPGTGSIPNGSPNFQTYGGVGFGPGYRTYTSDGNPLNLAKGNFWYLYDTMVSDRWVPLPFTLQAGGVEYAGLVGQNEYTPEADGTASYLLANPYAAPFDAAQLTETTGYTLSNSLFIWDADIGLAGDYVEVDRTAASVAERVVPVMSGFFADLTDTSGGTLGAPTFRFDPAGRVRPAPAPPAALDRRQIAFELELVDGADSYLVDRTTRLVFADGGAPGTDAFDATEPPAISSQYARLSFADGPVLRAVLGRELDPTAVVTSRLALSSLALGEQTYRLRWDAATLPAGWTAELRDLATGVTADLRADADLVFSAADGPATDRFELTVTSSSVVSGETAPESPAEVLAPRPNPSTGLASMRVRVDRPQSVRVEAFDLLGRRVATVFDGVIDTAQAVAVDASAFAPGLYVLRTTGETFATSHRFTVAR